MLKLTYLTLANLIRDFFDYMGRKETPSKDRIGKWFQKTNTLKETDVIEAFDWMKDNLDSIPHNIPKAIKAAVFEIQKAKPQPKPEIRSYGDCGDCGGTGIFKLRICTPEGQWHEPIRFCSQCENWRNWVNDPGIRVSAAELRAQGILFKPYNKTLRKASEVAGLGSWKRFESLATGVSNVMRLEA